MVKNRSYLYSIIYILAACFFHKGTNAQSAINYNLAEKFQIITDRALYSSGETVYFAVRETGLAEQNEFQISEVLCVDLITPEGQVLRATKHPLINGYSNGSLLIPEDALSGIYYLRTYTRWMRNYENMQMSYLSIRVINLSKIAQLAVQPAGDNNYQLKAIDSSTVHLDIKISTDKPIYQSREEVMVRLEGINRLVHTDPLIVSVFQRATQNGQVRNHSQQAEAYPGELEFLPETRGISLSGKVRNLENNEFEAFSPVFLTLLDEERNFYPGITDSAGAFYFSLPNYHGVKDMFISVKDKEEASLEVLIDRDFTLEHSPLPSFGISLDSLEYNVALDIVRNQQLRSQYYYEESQPEEQNTDSVFFYGVPSLSLDVDFYIDLPSLEEYFLELIPVVSIIRNHGIPRFRINGPQAEMKIYDPLVMIDGVVIHDNEAVLEIDPGNIERIDIVNRPWLRGDIMFGGIISLHSRKKDFAGVDLPESGLFLTYRFFEPDYSFPQDNLPKESHLPDFRNTLYWNPGLYLQAGEEKEIRFRTGDTTGDYIIRVRQITKDGQILEATHRFRVE